MFKNTFQIGIISVFFSVGSDPLQLWENKALAQEGGKSQFVTDEQLRSQVLELISDNIAHTYIACPEDPSRSLGIKHPHFVVQLKTYDKYFSMEIQIMDDKKKRRRFRVSNYQPKTRVKPYICTIPLQIEPNKWSYIALDLADYTKRVYGTTYQETLRVQIHANCRLRRVYFSDKVVVSEEDMPSELKLYAPRD